MGAARVLRVLVKTTVTILALGALALGAAKETPADVVAKHLDAIGSPEARSAATLRTATGKATADVISGGSGHMEGTVTVASMGSQFNFVMSFNSGDYIGEQFKFDGKNTFVADNAVAHRIHLGMFMYEHDAILKEGIWGGVWNTSWPLYDLKSRNAQFKAEGVKKVDGRKLLQFSYEPKHVERELRIHLYFEPDTFRHVKTVYELFGAANVPALTVTEDFSDFRDERGLMLPHAWQIRYEPDQQSGDVGLKGGAYSLRWNLTLHAVQIASATAAAPSAVAPVAAPAKN
jgi:hypothetical protein